jgi:hypothetical protein
MRSSPTTSARARATAISVVRALSDRRPEPPVPVVSRLAERDQRSELQITRGEGARLGSATRTLPSAIA